MQLSTWVLSIIIAYGLLDSARALNIFDGTLTEITCSAALPSFRLVKQERVYDSYNQLPVLFDIEARVPPTRNNVTLYINGTNRSNNVTVMCRNYDVSLNEYQILFTLILEFVSTLPAPNDVHYIEDSTARHLQILWGPPSLFSDQLGTQNISVDSKITHFMIYITINDTTTDFNVSGTSFTFENDNNISCHLSFQVAAVNPAGEGERSQLQIIDWCNGFTSITIVSEPGPAYYTSSGLSVHCWHAGGGIAAIVIGAVLIIIGLSVTLTIIFAKLKYYKRQYVVQSWKSELSGDMSDPKDMPPDDEEIKKHYGMETAPSGSDNDDNKDERHTPIQRGRSYSQDGPPTGQVYYAEIDVLAKKKNQIPVVEDASPHVYAVLEQSHDIVHHDQTEEVIETEQNAAYDKDHNHPDSENSKINSSTHDAG